MNAITAWRLSKKLQGLAIMNFVLKLKFSQRFLKMITLGVIIFTACSQLYSLINIKAFWLDEWFILYNLKFKSYSELFGNLYFSQQFPRVYLSIVKFLAEIFDYNYFSLRLLPTVLALISILLAYGVVSRVIFGSNIRDRMLFTLLFLSFHSTMFYFSQLKQYTMEIFVALYAIVFFDFLSRKYNNLKVNSAKFILCIFFIFAGSFFSYSFPIVISPVIFMLFISFTSNLIRRKLDTKAVILMTGFILSLFICYFTDLRFVLTDKGQYANFDLFVMGYASLDQFLNRVMNVFRLFTSIFYFDTSYSIPVVIILYVFKTLVLTGVILGFYIVFRELFLTIKRAKNLSLLSISNSPSVSHYLILVIIVTLTLYFLRILPLGQPRLTFYCVIPLAYFFIRGTSKLLFSYKQVHYILTFSIVFIAVFPAVRAGINEFRNKNLNFDQRIYENIGRAIGTAKKDKLPIVVANNEFYPASIMQNVEVLAIKAHHSYKSDDSIKVYTESQQDSLHLIHYLKLKKYDYEILIQR